jgi:MarR family transcriptional regulator, organic hydroperoxide resistance regulator
VKHIRETILFTLLQITRRFHKRAVHDLNALGLYAGQEKFLLLLWEQDGLTQTQIAESMYVEQATVTQVLDHLARAGLIQRSRDEKDGRISRVYLTEKGRALEEPVQRLWDAWETQALASFTQEERLLLRRFLLQMQANLE